MTAEGRGEPRRRRDVVARMRCGLALLVLQVGCAAAMEAGEIPTDADPPASVAPIAVRPDEPGPRAATPPAPPGEPRCRVLAEPRVIDPAPAPPPEHAVCRKVPSKLWKSVRRDIAKRWHARHDEKQLEIDHGCDRLIDPLREVVFETSSGHGGSLHLVALRPAEGGGWDLLWIDYDHYAGRAGWDERDPWKNDTTGEVAIHRGHVPAPQVDPILARARVLFHASVVEREPPARPGTIRLGRVSMSSRDYHAVLRLVDRDGHGGERFYVGYEGTGDDQSAGVTLDLVATAFRTLLRDEAFVATLERVPTSDPDARAFFSRRLWTAVARGDDFGRWYLRERLLGLAAVLGTPEHLPLLLDVARADGDASVARSRVLAIHAIAAMTGFDRRYDDDGTPRDVGAVARETIEACDGRAR